MPSNFITRHYVKSPALGGCSSSLLFEIIKKVLISVLSAWLGTEVHLSPGLAVIQELFRQGITWLSWISFQNLEESVGSGGCYSCLSQKCVLVKIKYSSSHHALPAPLLPADPHCLLPSSGSAMWQVNPSCTRFLSFWQCSSYLFVISKSLNTPFVLQMASLFSENSDKFLIAQTSLPWVQL